MWTSNKTDHEDIFWNYGKKNLLKIQHDKEPEAFSTIIFAHMHKSN